MEREGTSPEVVTSTSPSSSPVRPVLGPRAPSFHVGGVVPGTAREIRPLTDGCFIPREIAKDLRASLRSEPRDGEVREVVLPALAARRPRDDEPERETSGVDIDDLLARVSALVDIADAEGQSAPEDTTLVENLRAVFTHERDWTEKAAKLLDESAEKRRQEMARADRAEAALRAALSSERA